MADDSIQQIPQSRGNNAIPGLVTGAAVGGVGGWAAGKYGDFGIKTKPDLDEVFKQKPDYFESQIKKTEGDTKAFLEAAKTEVEKITNAGNTFDKVLEDAKIAKGSELTKEEIASVIKEKLNGFEGTKEDYIKKAVNESKETIKELAEKAKLVNKTWTGVAAAGALGLLGLLIGLGSKKD